MFKVFFLLCLVEWRVTWTQDLFNHFFLDLQGC